MNTEAARQIAAQCWTDDTTAHIEMNVDLAEAFASRIDELLADAETEKAQLLAQYSVYVSGAEKMTAMWNKALNDAKAREAELSKVIAQCAEAVGALAAPQCSLEFKQLLPAEIRAVVAELRARVSRIEREVTELKGMAPKPHQIRLLLNALDFYKTSAVHDPDDPYLNLDFLESIDFATEWLSALPAAPKEEV